MSNGAWRQCCDSRRRIGDAHSRCFRAFGAGGDYAGACACLLEKLIGWFMIVVVSHVVHVAYLVCSPDRPCTAIYAMHGLSGEQIVCLLPCAGC